MFGALMTQVEADRQAKTDDGKRGKKRDELAEKLARLYKEIDEVQL